MQQKDKPGHKNYRAPNLHKEGILQEIARNIANYKKLKEVETKTLEEIQESWFQYLNLKMDSFCRGR